jgi:hypothetical protein
MGYGATGVFRSQPGRTAALRELSALSSDVEQAWRLRQASRYSSLGTLLPRLIPEVELATRERAGDQRRTPFVLLSHT